MSKKDWVGSGRRAIYTTLGASSHTDEERELRDFYATDPIAAEILLQVEEFNGPIWEPAAGEGHLVNVFREKGYEVKATDIIERTFKLDEVRDFLYTFDFDVDLNQKIHIITNPPYKFAQEFIERSLDIVAPGYKVAMFLKLTFCEGKKRKMLFEHAPPKTIYVSSSRIACRKNGEFLPDDDGGSAVCYAWFVWEKGFKGNTTLKWIN
jgi:hypothetical protein